MKKKILLAVVIFLVIIQFVPISKTNPPVLEGQTLSSSIEPSVTPQVLSLLKGACYDCHSNETTYPNYTRAQPLGWWIKGHIKAGREKLNFSEWATYSAKEQIKQAQKCIEVMEQGRMPMKSYTWMHPKGKLSDQEEKILLDFFENLGD